jgi:3-deoxy-D-manno-oct-2-ulosonic acid (Kdo) hydroxylase
MGSASVAESVEERLERGEVVFHPEAPFALPAGADRAFLLAQQAGSRNHKDISFDPHKNKATGFARQDDAQKLHLEQVLGRFGLTAGAWLREALPLYAEGIEADRISFRPQEEATRRLRNNARNDLLHVDAFPRRPARGRRILRLFTNIHPTAPRVWVTSESLPILLPQVRDQVARATSWWRRLADLMDRRSESDRFMLRLHDFLKASHDFQRHGSRRLWYFPPGSAWLAMTDGCTYAELRGQYALEHSFFVSPEVLVRPDLAPEALLRVG